MSESPPEGEFDIGPDEGESMNPDSDPGIAQSTRMTKEDIGFHPEDTKNPHKEGVDKNLPKDPSKIIERERIKAAHQLFDPKSQN